MKAIRLHGHGGPEEIHLDDIPSPPSPGVSEIKVRVRAMALNHLDIWVRRGMPGIEQEMPLVMGCDAAGEVVEAGEGAGDFAPGKRVVLTPMVFCGVCAQCLAGEQSQCKNFRMRGEHEGGLFAEEVVVKTQAARVLADGVGFEQAAAFGLTFLTAWRMMITKARLKPGETVLIHGVGGGVSLAVLEICRRMGARSIVTSGEDWKIQKAIELGAAAGVNYKTGNIVREVYRASEGLGVDVVADSVGGSAWGISLKVVRPGGRVVTCGVTAGANPPADLTRIFWKQLHVMGSTMGNMREFSRVIDLLNTGKLTPVIDRAFPAEEAPAAHEYLASPERFGKVVLRF